MLVKSDILSLSSLASTTVQPASGELWVLRSWGSTVFSGTFPDDTAEMNIRLYDGTYDPIFTTNAGVEIRHASDRFVINNSKYMYIKNSYAGSVYIFYCAVIKGP